MTTKDAFTLIEHDRKNQMRLARRAEMQGAPELLVGFLQGVAAGLSVANIHVQEIDEIAYEEFE